MHLGPQKYTKIWWARNQSSGLSPIVLERRPGARGALMLICGPLAWPRRWSEVGRVRRAGAWKCRVKKNVPCGIFWTQLNIVKPCYIHPLEVSLEVLEWPCYCYVVFLSDTIVMIWLICYVWFRNQPWNGISRAKTPEEFETISSHFSAKFFSWRRRIFYDIFSSIRMSKDVQSAQLVAVSGAHHSK